MTINRRQFGLATAATAVMPLARAQSTASSARFGKFFADVGGDCDNLIITEPHIGGMFFLAYEALGGADGPIAALSGKRRMGLELPDKMPGFRGVSNLQRKIDMVLAGDWPQDQKKTLIATTLFDGGHIRPTMMNVPDEPAIMHISPEERLERFSVGLGNTINIAVDKGMGIELMGYLNPAMQAFMRHRAHELKSPDTRQREQANRDYAMIQHDGRYQYERLQERMGGSVTGLVAVVGWQHTAGIVPVPGLDELLPGKTRVVSLFHSRANEAEAVRMSAPIGTPTRQADFNVYLSTGEITAPKQDARVVARFEPIDGLRVAQSGGPSVAQAPRP